MQKALNKACKQSDLMRLFWVFGLLLFLAIGFASHAETAGGTTSLGTNKTDYIILSTPNLYGQHFFTAVINSPDPQQAPKNFRAFTSNGFETFHASASAVFSKGQLDFLIAKLNSDSVAGTPGEAKKIHVIDIGSHNHGFVNNMQVIWLSQIYANAEAEKALLMSLKKQKRMSLYTIPDSVDFLNLDPADFMKMRAQKIQVQADSVETEEQVIKSKKLSYSRIPLSSDDLTKIDAKQINQLATIIAAAKKNEWFHIHNEVGDRAASTAVLLLDILKNAGGMSLNDILARENDFSAQVKISPIGPSPALENIYTYAKENGPKFKKSFTLAQ